jgi:diguanylate cyclase (GGDEF)-like protein
MKRSTTPENSAARSQLLALLVLGVGVALSGGPDSPVLAWAVIPGAMAAARFRWQIVVLGAGITAVVVLVSTVAVDPAGALHDPAPVVVTLALLVCVTSITSVLPHGELLQRNRAVLDPLTGLLNRAALETRVEEIEQQARLTGEPRSLVLADLDGFKRVNDEHGHDRGDAALRQVAYQMRASLRSFELVYRLGGEEFLVLLPGIELREATQIAERMRCAVADARPADLELTMSAGVACSAGELSYDTLLKAADEALFKAKREGRNRVRAARKMPTVSNERTRRFRA